MTFCAELKSAAMNYIKACEYSHYEILANILASSADLSDCPGEYFYILLCPS